jgi:pyridoxal/pyridoxine/pyridoxamine kinase
VIAQPNGNISHNNTTDLDLDSDSKNIVVTWLESNETNTNSAPMISVSNKDFWEIIGPLFELSTNGSVNTFG